MKYLYTSLALISYHLSAMELPSSTRQWANTPAKNVMALFSSDKVVFFNGKKYAATNIQHAYLELLREESGDSSEFMWQAVGLNGTKFKLIHYIEKGYDLQVFLGFDEDGTALSLYGGNYQSDWLLADQNMLSFLKLMGRDISYLLPSVPPSKPINKSLSTSETFRVLTEMPRVIPQWLLSQTPSWLNRKNIAVACFGGAIGLGFVKVVVPKVKTTLHNIAILQSQVVAITALLRYSNIKFWAFPPALDKAGHLEYNKAASFLFGIKKQ